MAQSWKGTSNLGLIKSHTELRGEKLKSTYNESILYSMHSAKKKKADWEIQDVHQAETGSVLDRERRGTWVRTWQSSPFLKTAWNPAFKNKCKHFILLLFVFCLGRAYPAARRSYSWLCARNCSWLRGPCGYQGWKLQTFQSTLF